MSIFDYIGIFCTAWMSIGIVFFIIGGGFDWFRGVRNDGEWMLGLAICIGAGPVMLWIATVSWLDERRIKRRARRT
jgi:hypothetical protein